MRVVIRGYLASWAASLRPYSNQCEPNKEDGFVAQLSIADVRREIMRAAGPLRQKQPVLLHSPAACFTRFSLP